MNSRAPLAAVVMSSVLVASAASYLAADWWLPSAGTAIEVLAPREPGLLVQVVRPGGVLAERLVGAVQDTMQPAHAWLWLRPGAAEPDAAVRDTAASQGRLA